MTLGNDKLWLLIENLQDALLKVEWVRSHNGKWMCAFCGATSARDGGDDHKEECEWQRLVSINRGNINGLF